MTKIFSRFTVRNRLWSCARQMSWNNADIDRTGDIALDFDASARFHSARILRLFFRNAPSITALVVVTGCNKTIGCRDSSFKPICLKVKRTPRRGLARLAWGVISGIPRDRQNNAGTGPWPDQRHLKAPSRLHRRGFWREGLIRCRV